MSKILINSELPLALMEENNEVNDFDFVLFSLWEKYPSYKEFFLKNRKENPERMMIFDNSAYEFFNSGEMFDEGKFIEAIKELNPTYYIVPDVLMNKEVTIASYKEWRDKLPGYKKMVVPQGKSFLEWIDCYERFSEDPKIEMIGIPFHNDFFYDMGLTGTLMVSEGKSYTDKDFLYSFGRCIVLQYLKNHNLVKEGCKIHLLGTHHWNEMKSIGSTLIDFIYSADTSYPVTRGLMKDDLEVKKPKPSISVEDFIDMNISDVQAEKILENIKKFHSYVEVQ